MSPPTRTSSARSSPSTRRSRPRSPRRSSCPGGRAKWTGDRSSARRRSCTATGSSPGRSTRTGCFGQAEGMDAASEDPGERTRREVLGDEHVDRAQARATEFTAPFQDFITRYAWGEVWNRPGLDRRQRSMITLATLTAVRAEGELELHVRAALRNGLAPEEIREVLLHTAVYAGGPAANAAFAIAQRVLEEG